MNIHTWKVSLEDGMKPVDDLLGPPTSSSDLRVTVLEVSAEDGQLRVELFDTDQ